MSEFKERAELRKEGLKRLLAELERERDMLLDKVANYKGQADHAEKIITKIYQMLLDINKEEQQQEAKVLAEEVAKREKEKKDKEFAEASRGIKTPKRRSRKS